MDTDSFYFAISHNSLLDTIEANLGEEKYREVTENGELRSFLCHMGDPDGLNDRFTPGLFKLEFEGLSMICLSPKTYIVWTTVRGAGFTNIKYSSKGLSKRNNLLPR
jgi:hypothetical protein